MIRNFQESDLDVLMQIWLNANISAHSFVPEEYWTGHFGQVKELLVQAELYIYEDDHTGAIRGFIGLMEDYIAGIFVADGSRSQGIGRQLLDYARVRKQHLSLHVYEKNQRAVGFYLREHFQVKEQRVDADTGETELVMEWRA